MQFKNKDTIPFTALWAMLALTLSFLVIVLAQGYQAALSQQNSAEALLQDYSRLILAEYKSTLGQQLGYRQFYLANQEIQSWRPQLAIDGAQDLAAPALAAAAVAQLQQRFPLLKNWQWFCPSCATDRRSGVLNQNNAVLASLDWPGLAELPLGAMKLQYFDSDKGSNIYVLSRFTQSWWFVYQFTSSDLDSVLQTAWQNAITLPQQMDKSGFNASWLDLHVSDTSGQALYQTEATNKAAQEWSIALQQAYPDYYQGALAYLQFALAISYDALPTLAPGSSITSPKGYLLLSLFALALLAILALMFYQQSRLLKMKQQFIDQVSHELRTPLTQIRMYSETLLMQRMADPAQQQSALAIINREAQHMSAIVSNNLTLSKLQRTGSVVLEPVNLSGLLTEFCQELETQYQNSRVSFDCQIQPGIKVNANVQWLRQILYNLLHNAVKFGPDGQTVGVTLGKAGANAGVEITVQDQGPGLAPSMLDKPWLPYQSEQPNSGAGLGLYVCDQLAIKMGAQLQARNQCNNGGAIFKLVFKKDNT